MRIFLKCLTINDISGDLLPDSNTLNTIGKYTALSFFLALSLALKCQEDSTLRKFPELRLKSYDITQLKGAAFSDKLDSLLHPELHIGGYVSTYYAFYDAESEANGFVLFPTLAPRNNQFSLNMALLNFDYRSTNARAAITLHYGDVPESSWPETFNLIQEARAGFRIHKKLWFDAGFFKSHIGLESFQPRENITSSMAVPSYYSPYYLSGAKLTYQATDEMAIQLGVYNGFNEYIDNNKNKAINLSLNYNPGDQFSLTYNFLTCDESPDSIATSHQRYHQNLYASYFIKKFTLAGDLTYCLQENSTLSDSTRMASMYSAILVGKYQALKKFAIYSRLEYFSDENRIMTGSLAIGKYIQGLTAGIEFKPLRTVCLSAEWRGLQADNMIFKNEKSMSNFRDEIIFCLDLWF